MSTRWRQDDCARLPNLLSQAPPPYVHPASASSWAVANTHVMCAVQEASASYCSAPTVRFVLHPLCEPPHSGMISKRLHRVITSCKVGVADRDMNVSVAGSAQGDRPSRVAPLELLSTLPSALHLPGARAWQEMVAGETILSDGPAAQLTPACSARFRVLVARYHPEIMRAFHANGPRRRAFADRPRGRKALRPRSLPGS